MHGSLAYDPSPVERMIVECDYSHSGATWRYAGRDVFYGEDIVNILDQSTSYQNQSVHIEPEDERVERIRKMMEELEHKRVQQVMDEIGA